MNRSTTPQVADRFIHLMRAYDARAKAVFSGFEMNPSPGNIRDGLITDAMKSAGAAKKGGTSPVTAVIDYPEYSTEAGLNLQCTPGNDVECVTAQVGAGANRGALHHRARNADRKSDRAGGEALDQLGARAANARHHRHRHRSRRHRRIDDRSNGRTIFSIA